ncbi:MAG TPA: esterase-like activity of phytase family protein, partial [Salinimicrobium sp.]|nr:esterase-like activity of phytase family protein [Salinimicrobium sp.]
MGKSFYGIAVMLLFLAGCKSSKTGSTNNVQVRFLDEYIIPDSLEIGKTLVGGLSGIDYSNGKYFIVSDNPSNPRFYKVDIQIENEEIDTIIFSEVIELNTEDSILQNKHLDLEGIRYSSKNENIIVSSEGAIKNSKDPGIFVIS